MIKKVIVFFVIVLLIFSTSCKSNKIISGNHIKNDLPKVEDFKKYIPKNADNIKIKSSDLDNDGEEEKIIAFYEDNQSKAIVLDYNKNGWKKYDLFLEQLPEVPKTTMLADTPEPNMFLIDDINKDGKQDIVLDWHTGSHIDITYVFDFYSNKVINLITIDSAYRPADAPVLKDTNNDGTQELFAYDGNWDPVTDKVIGITEEYVWSTEKRQYVTNKTYPFKY